MPDTPDMILVLLACTSAPTSDAIVGGERPLGSIHLGDVEAPVVAVLTSHQQGPRLEVGHFDPSWTPGHTDYSIRFSVQSDLEHRGERPRGETVGFREPQDAVKAFEAVKLESCEGPDTAALRITGIDRWYVMRRIGNAVFTRWEESASCPQLPSPEAFRETARFGCISLIEAGFPDAGARCILRGGRLDVASLPPSAAGPIREVLMTATDPSLDPWSTGRSGADLPEDAWEPLLAACPSAGCPDWRLAALAGMAGRSGNADRCALVLDRAANAGPEGRREALRHTLSCGGDAQLAPAMRAGLTQVTGSEYHHELPNHRDYGGAAGACAGHRVLEPYEWSECRQLPRLAGAWLAAHCDAAAVDAARQALDGYTGDFDVRRSMVLDGALRVLGACDVKAFEAAIAAAPEKAPTPAAVDVRSQERLRELYLP